LGAPQQADDPGTAARDALVADLEQRIRELDERDDEDFGAFNRMDWVILVLLSMVLPFFLLLHFAP
jgi:hypothetical protein